MRIIVFLPGSPEFTNAAQSLRSSLKGATIVDLSDLGAADPAVRIESALSAGSSRTAVVVNPPLDEAACSAVERALEADVRLKGPVRAVFYSPARAGDAMESYRSAVRPLFKKYSGRGSAFEFRKPRQKDLARAVKAASLASSPIRWGALLPAMAVFVAASAAIFVARDLLARKVLVRQSQAVFGARTDVMGLRTTLTPSLEISGFAVADRSDPMKNLFEIERMSGDVDLFELAYGRVRVQEMSVTGLRFGTSRTESGELPGREAKQLEPGEKAAEKPPGDGKVFEDRFREFIEEARRKLEPPALSDLKTVKFARETEAECSARFVALRSRVAEADLPARFEKNRFALESLYKREPPASVGMVKSAWDKARGVDLGSAQIEALRAKAAEFALSGFQAEKALAESLRADVLAVRESASRVNAAVDRARRIKKVTLLDVPAIKRLLEDMDTVTKEVPKARARLESAFSSLEKLNSSIQSTQESLLSKAGSLDGMAAEAKKAVEEAAPQLAAAIEEAKAAAGAAAADIEKESAELVAAYSMLHEEFESLAALATEFEHRLRADAEYLATRPKAAEEAVEEDYRTLESRYDFDLGDARDLIEPLVGDSLASFAFQAWDVYVAVKPFLARTASAGKPKTVKNPAGRGTDWVFPPPSTFGPTVWIGKIAFEGVFRISGRDYQVIGTLTDLADDAGATGKPVAFSFVLTRGAEKIACSGAFGDGGECRMSVSFSGMPLDMPGIKARWAPEAIRARDMSARLEVAFATGAVGVKGSFRLEGIEIAFESGDDPLSSLVSRFYSGITGLEATAGLVFRSGRLESLELGSDAAQVFRKAFEDAVKAQISELKDRARAMLDERMKDPVAAMNEAIAAFGRDGASVIAGLGPAGGAFAGSKGRIEEKIKAISGMLDSGAAPPAAGDGARDVEQIESGYRAKSLGLSKEHEEQVKAAAEIASSLAGERSGLEGSSKSLSAEIERIKALLKKAAGF